MEIQSCFSDRLNELMFDSKNISMATLAAKIGVTEATVSRWKSGKQLIYLSNLIKIADFFNCSIEFLAGLTETKIDFTPKPCPSFYDRFRDILAQKNITRYRFTKETRFKDQFLAKWKNGADIHMETLIEISRYLDCTIDYLVGRESA